MGRRQQIHELQAAEAELASRRQLLRQSARQRVDYLRVLGPYWLIGGGFVAGFVTQRFGGLIGVTILESPLAMGLRLWPMLSAGFNTGLAASTSTA